MSPLAAPYKLELPIHLLTESDPAVHSDPPNEVAVSSASRQRHAPKPPGALWVSAEGRGVPVFYRSQPYRGFITAL